MMAKGKLFILFTQTPRRKTVIILVILALCICSLGYFRYASVSSAHTGALYHKQLGKEVSSGTWLTSQNFGKVRTPGHPIIIGAIYTFLKDSDMYVIAMQVIVFSVIAATIFFIGEVLFSWRVGLLSAVWYITYYDYVRMSFLFLREIWTTLFILSTLAFYVTYSRNHKLTYLVLGALSFGYLVIIDPRYSFFLFVLLLFIFFFSKNWSQRIKDLTITMVGALVFLAPWAIHQSRVYRRTVVFSPYYDAKIVSFAKAYGAIDETVTYSLSDIQRGNELNDVMHSGLPWSTEIVTDKQLTVRHGERLKTKVLWNVIGTRSKCFVEYWRFTRFRSGIGTGTNVKFISPWSLPKNINNIIHIGLLLPFVFVGGYLILKKRQISQLLVFSFFCYHLILHVATFYLYRYRLHILPILFLIGWYGANCVLRGRYRNQVP